MKLQIQDGPVDLQTPIRFADKLPNEVDIVIVGGGVVGVSSALFLADEGFSVALIEKGRIACEQSSRNWGWVRQHGRDPDELPIMMEANRLWGELDVATKGKTGFRRGGVMYLSSSQERMEKRMAWLDVAKAHQLDTRVLSAAQVGERIQQGEGAHKWIGATYTPSDGRAEPWQAVPALCELAQEKGTAIIENCAARALEITNGELQGVITENGTIKCSQVVLAAGAWSSLFLQRHAVSIPQLSVRSSVNATAEMPEIFGGNAADETLAFRRRADGRYTISISSTHDLFVGPDSFRHLHNWLPAASTHWRDTKLRINAPKGFPDHWLTRRRWNEDEESPFEKMRVLAPKPDTSRNEELKNAFAARFPQLGPPKLTHSWAGMIDAMPDIVPIVDRVPQIKGVILGTGMSGHGFGIGPGFGKIIAKIAAGKPTGHNTERFRFARFTDGSKMKPGPAI
ncbi:MAG: FAD-binding oxidoreductase [Pseudomonadota bacterium]